MKKKFQLLKLQIQELQIKSQNPLGELIDIDNTEIKVDIESLRKDIENVNTIHNRLDTAIDRLTDVSTSIKSMARCTRRKDSETRKDR